MNKLCLFETVIVLRYVLPEVVGREVEFRFTARRYSSVLGNVSFREH